MNIEQMRSNTIVNELTQTYNSAPSCFLYIVLEGHMCICFRLYYLPHWLTQTYMEHSHMENVCMYGSLFGPCIHPLQQTTLH